MDIKDSLAVAAESLNAAGVPDARREAGTLLTFALSKPRAFLVAHPDYKLSEIEASKFGDVVRRRTSREPFHLIVGSREFFGLEFFVEAGVLIPRPETEILVERALDVLPVSESSRIFEIGVGTGCISISILAKRENAVSSAVDISEQALALSGRNAERHGVGKRLTLQKADLFDGQNGMFDLIVSNPPYVPDGELPRLEPEVINFDPPTALFGGDDGLDLIRRIVAEAPAHLKPGGHLLIEIGAGQSAAARSLFPPSDYVDIELVYDLQGTHRVIKATRSTS